MNKIFYYRNNISKNRWECENLGLDYMKKLEETFMEYTTVYDKNIKKLINERGVEISNQEINEILHDAKYMTVNNNA